MSEAVKALCYGCVWGREERVMHNLCTLDVGDQGRFCLYYALDFVNEAEIMEQYGTEMGLGGLEWINIFDYGYRHSQWMSNEEWFNDMVSRVTDKLKLISVSSSSTISSSSPSIGISLSGPLEWMTDKPPGDWVLLVEGQASSRRLSPSGGRTKLMSKVLPAIEFMWWQDSVLPAIEFLWW